MRHYVDHPSDKKIVEVISGSEGEAQHEVNNRYEDEVVQQQDGETDQHLG